MASKKRENPTTQEHEQEQEPHHKKQNVNVSTLETHTESCASSSSPPPSLQVVLNPADCDLAFNIEADGLTGHALYDDGFAYCWSGARGNVGIIGGKYCFGCIVISDQSVTMEDTPSDQQHVCRVGISRGDDPVGNLGETEHSFGYGGTGKFSNAGRFVDYGERFDIGDRIVCLVDLESKPFASLEFSKNGKRLGMAKFFDAGPNGLGVIDSPPGELPWQSALFPHILLKNTVVKMQFSIEDGLAPEKGYKPWDSAVKDGKAVIGPGFPDPNECEVIMMVGLPASGKTTWAEKHIKDHPEKRYILLGTNLVLDQMKVPGLMRKSNYGERFDRLMDRATKMFNTLLSRASKLYRNYIIDQTNVYKSARKRKLKPFQYFGKLIAVVVYPRPEELEVRSKKRFEEMGKEVPSEEVDKMIANFVLPKSKHMLGTDEYFDEVIFPELGRDEALQHLDEMQCAIELTSMVTPKNDNPPYPRESYSNSGSRISASSLPGPGPPYSGFSSPSLGLHTGLGSSWIDRPDPALQPNIANVNRGFTGLGQHGVLDSMQQHSFNVNTRSEGPRYSGRLEQPAGPYYQGSLNSMVPGDGYPRTFLSYSNLPREDRGYPRAHSGYRGPVPGDNHTQFGSYMHDPGTRPEAAYSHGTPGYGSYAKDARSASQPPYISPDGTPNLSPLGNYPAGVRRSGTAPYHPPR